MKASSPKRNSTPDSMPAARDIGILLIARSNHPVKPTSVTSAPDTRNAPIASGIETPAALVISMAAPEVDQAVAIGIR